MSATDLLRQVVDVVKQRLADAGIHAPARVLNLQAIRKQLEQALPAQQPPQVMVHVAGRTEEPNSGLVHASCSLQLVLSEPELAALERAGSCVDEPDAHRRHYLQLGNVVRDPLLVQLLKSMAASGSQYPDCITMALARGRAMHP